MENLTFVKKPHKTSFIVAVMLFASLARGAPVEISGTLSDDNDNSLEGVISVFTESGAFRAEHHDVDETGVFKFSTDSAGGLILVARSSGYATAERLVPDGKTGSVAIDFELPTGQEITGRVLNSSGDPVVDAAVQVRYQEPDLPPRRVLFDTEDRSGSDGYFSIAEVGTGVNFYIDVYSPHYLAKTSSLFKLAVGATDVGNIVLGDPVGTVVVSVVDKNGQIVEGAEVELIADKAGIPDESLDSWLHYDSYDKAAATTSRGTVRFVGVPPGSVTVLAKTATSRSASEETTAKAGEEVTVTLELL